ncbi:VPA1262 family N-terminal domain-containing protein [Paenibacillus yanchengensis]|uniref:VPA1262 family N-terminal domain-containing protein n=1 Tax=Paenibacillus yanchengensis TaxID=2035833 RepID=A0ABW4YJW7_9BACL
MQTNTVENTLIESDAKRELKALEEKRVFLYFPGGTQESSDRAKKIVRELLSTVKERCIICDPYLSSSDIVQYALVVRYSQVKVRLISSIAFLKDKADRNIDESHTHAEKIVRTLKEIKEQDSRLNIECRALVGRDKSPLHDRFLVIDNEVYLLGSSLNEFGSRATTLFRAPDSKLLIDAAETWWNSDNDTTDLYNWLQKKDETIKSSKLGGLFKRLLARFNRNNS